MARKKDKITRKQLLNEPDEILSVTRKTFNWILANKGYVALAIGVLFSAALIYSAVGYFADKAERQAFSRLQALVDRYQEARQSGGEAEDAVKKAYEAVREDMTTLVREYSSRSGGKMARIVLAGMAYDAGDYETASKFYSASLDEIAGYPSLKNLVISGLAYSLAGKSAYGEAIANFEKIASGEDDVMKADALYNLGRLYAETGNPEKSKSAYERLVSDFPDSVHADFAKDQLTGLAS